MERESDDQVLVGLQRDAHICSGSSTIFARRFPVSASDRRRKEEEMKGV